MPGRITPLQQSCSKSGTDCTCTNCNLFLRKFGATFIITVYLTAPARIDPDGSSHSPTSSSQAALLAYLPNCKLFLRKIGAIFTVTVYLPAPANAKLCTNFPVQIFHTSLSQEVHKRPRKQGSAERRPHGLTCASRARHDRLTAV